MRPAAKTSSVKNRRNTGQFPKGQSGNPAGRPNGVPNKATTVGKELCRNLIDDPVYQQAFAAAFMTRKLDKELEKMVWHYAYGRPKDECAHQLGGRITLAHIIAGIDPEDE